MKKELSNSKKIVLFILIVSLVMVGFQIVYGAVAEPGSQEDPIITQSYLEEIVVPQIQESINAKLTALTQKVDQIKQGEPQQSASGDKYTVVSVAQGQKLIGAAGTEVILRMGKATIIATAKGGVADVTQGIDLPNGTAMPANHLLIIPVDDGRGLAAQQDLLVMVKGAYTLQ
ncbi:hypothetical protein [Petroclostridium sp. X23]|uniref:hypothetical protein n=1 Tax=Petroclostridium sp. X23 TaxID=3045146 RepID=UPI0024ADF0A3|nr:hypothetical protein [Petroclostridium sp. X23]WHH58099.1 hypothetical protein QKW49_20190 [Petroclostridium sp. X23]